MFLVVYKSREPHDEKVVLFNQKMMLSGQLIACLKVDCLKIRVSYIFYVLLKN